MHGLLQLPWWGYIVVTLVLTQITILAVTIFLHRCQAHRSLHLHPIVSHFFRLWLWLTTGMVTKEWAAIHRKHHAKVETAEDPHSPQVKGIWQVLLEGAELYKKEAKNPETLARYGEGTPDDWMERNVYSAHSALGILITLFVDIALFGFIGLSIWAIQMAWIPFFAAGIINGVGHFVGYRNFDTQDSSRNLTPWGLIIGGEELHNNHHTFATSAKFSVKWWEFDIGWAVIRLLQFFGLAKPKRTAPQPKIIPGKTTVDVDTLKALITNRFVVMSRYSKEVVLPVLREEKRKAGIASSAILRRIRRFLTRENSVDGESKTQLVKTIESFSALNVVYQFRIKLQNIWARSTAKDKELMDQLQEWCRLAEASGIDALNRFVNHLKSYAPQQTTT